MSHFDDTWASRENGEVPTDGAARPLATSESGWATEVDESAVDAGLGDVVICEIPDANDLTHMVWTARCTLPSHGLLGTFVTREMADQAKQKHLLLAHGRPDLP
jgi:hypothetical protein